LREADEEYMKHLEDIKSKEELARKKEKEWCEMEYKRYNEQYVKSTANYETYLAKKKEMDKATYENLTSVERKIAEGYSRSIERKE
jgi:Skp family chaperone for outer membrane proteins